MSKPPPLFAWGNEQARENAYTAPALARRSDHDSSHQSADAIERNGTRARHEAAILRALREAGKPLDAHEIAGLAGLASNVAVCRRMSALVDAGAVERIKAPGERLRWRAR